MNNTNEEGYITIWEAPKIVPPEFRLYYDEVGKVICYSCEKLEGNYIVIDSLTYAQGRPDIRVIDGRISTVQTHAIISKLIPNIQGIVCASEDVSIVIEDKKSTIKTTYWKLHTYEL